MTGYKIYITKSAEVARLLRDAVLARLGQDGIKRDDVGCVCEDCRIPRLYHGEDNFYCAVEYDDRTGYEIVMA